VGPLALPPPASSHALPHRVAGAPGYSDLAIADELGVNRHTCRLWRRRIVAEGRLWEVAEGRGRRPQSGLAERIINATLQTEPKGQTHWSSRTMAKAQGEHASTVQRIRQEHGLQPHRQ
jgi:transposase